MRENDHSVHSQYLWNTQVLYIVFRMYFYCLTVQSLSFPHSDCVVLAAAPDFKDYTCA